MATPCTCCSRPPSPSSLPPADSFPGGGVVNFDDLVPLDEADVAPLRQNRRQLGLPFQQGEILGRGEGHAPDLLPAPARLEEAEAINAGHLEKIIGFLKANLGFRWVLIDCCHQLDEITMKALEFSETLMVVTGQSIPALSNAKKMLEILNLLELKELEVEVLVNFWDRQHDLGLADVENFLGKKISATITCDYKQASFSINEGKLLVEISPRHPISGDLKLIAGKISQEDTPEESNGSGWKWLRSLWSKKTP